MFAPSIDKFTLDGRGWPRLGASRARRASRSSVRARHARGQRTTCALLENRGWPLAVTAMSRRLSCKTLSVAMVISERLRSGCAEAIHRLVLAERSFPVNVSDSDHRHRTVAGRADDNEYA
jgi:hypothetical protein